MDLQPATTIGSLANGRDQQTLTYHGIILWILDAYLYQSTKLTEFACL
jgi:hypothetical protein